MQRGTYEGKAVVNSAAIPAGAPTGQPSGERPRLTRRSAGLVLVGALCSATAVLQVRPFERSEPGPNADAFDETYLGRHIVGTRQPGSATGAGAWQVTVDGRPLHLMRRADGSYMSMVDHYTSYDSPLAAAKAAVDELGDQQLRPQEGEM
ncbi:tyrosinase family oxidase copper chaperone [Streptomyces sp. NPDC004856]|uniref:tyrosinase family oxidase copper chaperone n=1 Tax=Streptomyces sp. NPDC004856 TaxID=3154556 RepID=UPI0033B2303F